MTRTTLIILFVTGALEKEYERMERSGKRFILKNPLSTLEAGHVACFSITIKLPCASMVYVSNNFCQQFYRDMMKTLNLNDPAMIVLLTEFMKKFREKS